MRGFVSAQGGRQVGDLVPLTDTLLGQQMQWMTRILFQLSFLRRLAIRRERNGARWLSLARRLPSVGTFSRYWCVNKRSRQRTSSARRSNSLGNICQASRRRFGLEAWQQM